MHKFFNLLFYAILFSSFSLAQSAKVSGSVSDPNENRPVQNAVIALLTPKDSILYKFTRSNTEGKFILKDIRPGKYILMCSHPYFAEVLDEIEIKGDTVLPVLALISKSKLLQEIIVKTGSPIKIRGDTTVYTADSFKVSANANVEELLKKLPGIQVDKDGKIKAMGETVEKVLVDGEEFFGDDPGMAVKNLRADAVKEVQVFNKKSDQSVFTGIDDGKTQKTINLALKEDKKRGYFGKIDVAAGSQQHIQNRYNDNLLFSSFKGKRKFSGFLLNGNTGQDRISWQDEQKYGGDDMSMTISDDGDIMFNYTGGSSDDEPYVDSQNGFLTNVNAGAQYSNKWNDKHTINFSPKYNKQDYINHKKSFNQTQIGDSVLIENANNVSNVRRNNIKLRGIYDVKLDSLNSLKLTTNSNFYHTESSDQRMVKNTGNTGTLKNTSDRLLQTNSDKNAFSGSLLLKHKFKKLRRTFSIGADWNTLNTQGKDYLVSVNQSYFNGIPSNRQNVDQMKDFNTDKKNLSAKIIYTEPLSKKYSLELGYQLAFNNGNNNQVSYSFSQASGKYDRMIDSLSNQFKQNIIQNIPSAKINYSDKKLKINAGSGFGVTHFELRDITFNKNYTRNYINFFPSGNLNYTYKSNHNIRINYNGNTRQPAISQLQPLRNNNDNFNQYIGNPDLKPSFTNSFNLSHSAYNFLKDISFYQSVNLRVTKNSITNNRTINLDSGKTISQPINTNGNYSINFYGGGSIKIKKIDTRIGLNPSINYDRYVEVINGKQSFSKTFSPRISLYLSKSKEKKYDISLREDYSYSSNTTAQNNIKTHYNTNTLSVYGTFYIKKVWSIISDYQYYYRQKISSFNADLNNHILNGRLQRTFKNNEFTAYITVRDILNQNIGIDRNFRGNTYSETSNDRLKRYFLVGFTWDFKNKSSSPK